MGQPSLGYACAVGLDGGLLGGTKRTNHGVWNACNGGDGEYHTEPECNFTGETVVDDVGHSLGAFVIVELDEGVVF